MNQTQMDGEHPQEAPCKYAEDSENVDLAARRIYLAYGVVRKHFEQKHIEWRGRDNPKYANSPQFDISPTVVEQIAKRIDKDSARLRYFHDMNDVHPFKMGGIYCHWVARLRPVFYGASPDPLSEKEWYLNETLAIYAGIIRSNQIPPNKLTAAEKHHRREMLKQLHDGLAYNLKFRLLSSDDLALIIQSIMLK